MTTKKSAAPKTPAKAATTSLPAALPTIGFLGLGIMGSAMSGNLMKAGFAVHGFDPSSAARQRFKKAGGTPHADAAALAQTVDVVITSLPSGKALIEVATIMAQSGKKGQAVIETSTLDVTDKTAARDILAPSGITLLDCPLSGTGAQAVKKDLTVYSSGPAKMVKQLDAVFQGFTKANYYLGDFGNGMKMKLMANLLVAIHNVSTAEVLSFGKAYGIDPALAVKVLADGAGGSRMLDVRGGMMATQEWSEATMKVSTWQKDMYLIAQALAATQSAAPLFAACVPVYNAAMGLGHADHDTAAVFDVLEVMAGKKKAKKDAKK